MLVNWERKSLQVISDMNREGTWADVGARAAVFDFTHVAWYLPMGR